MDFTIDALPTPKPTANWLIEGEGLPARVCVGSPDCGANTHLDIVNRNVRGRRYTRARQIAMGATAIKPKFDTPADCSYSGEAGRWAFDGTRPDDVQEQGSIKTTAELTGNARALVDEGNYLTTTWKVTTPSETVLLVHPSTATDRQQLIEQQGRIERWMKKAFRGACLAERIDSGCFETLPRITASRINLILHAQ